MSVKFNFPRQSPIDLITSKAVTRPLPTLEIVEPDMQGHQAKFYNSGHTGKCQQLYLYLSASSHNEGAVNEVKSFNSKAGTQPLNSRNSLVHVLEPSITKEFSIDFSLFIS